MPKRKKTRSEVEGDDVDSSAEEEETQQLGSPRQQQQQERGRINISNTAIRSGGAIQVKESITAIMSVSAVSTPAQKLDGSSDITVRNEGVVAEGPISAGSITAHIEDPASSSSSANAKHEKASVASKSKNDEEAYDLEGAGSVLIINNMLEKNSLAGRPVNPAFEVEERKGSDVDVEATKKLFKDMGCNVFVENNIQSTQLHRKLDAFKARCKDSSFCLIVVMTHGGMNKLLMEDLREVDIYEDLVYQFSEENFKNFKGRPKIFLIQACGSKGSGADGVVAGDGGSPRRRSPSPPSGEVADVFLGLACLSHRKAYRHTVYGSWYIQSIQEIFERCWRNEDLETMHKSVDSCVFNKVAEENLRRPREDRIQRQTPNINKIGFYKRFFFPSSDQQ